MKILAPLLAVSLFILLVSVDIIRGETSVLAPLHDIAIQDRGRLKPLDTFARETLRTITGNEVWASFKGSGFPMSGQPVSLLLSMMLKWQTWSEEPVIKVRLAALRSDLDFPSRRVSFKMLSEHKVFREALRRAFTSKEQGKELTEKERALLELFQQVELFRSLSKPQDALAIICPTTGEHREEMTWLTVNQAIEAGFDNADVIAEAFTALETAVAESQFEVLLESANRLADLLAAAKSHLRHPQLELHYNRLKPFRLASILLLVSAFFWLVALLVEKRTALVAAWALSVLGIASQIWGFTLRVLISGRAPVTNMYESLVFMALGIVLVSALFEGLSRSKMLMLSGSLTAGMLLVMAQVLPIDSSIAVIVPVLRSNFWLVLHVLVIMLSYSAMAEAWALGHVILLRSTLKPEGLDALKSEVTFLYRTLQVGVLLLTAGIVLGAMWANVSWGRYWGWDPKETWSLICLFGYLALLHARSVNWVGRFGLAVGSILAFMLVVMCYYGVNFLLRQGLHNYGSGSGGVPYAIAYLVADAVFVLAVFWRHRRITQIGSLENQ
ncbi:MAG TPA: cytochrome c biogenesis protein CcsA [bacterium]|nr:cytochrome c biogenesis protein CcsA [bacterium]